MEICEKETGQMEKHIKRHTIILLIFTLVLFIGILWGSLYWLPYINSKAASMIYDGHILGYLESLYNYFIYYERTDTKKHGFRDAAYWMADYTFSSFIDSLGAISLIYNIYRNIENYFWIYYPVRHESIKDSWFWSDYDGKWVSVYYNGDSFVTEEIGPDWKL